MQALGFWSAGGSGGSAPPWHCGSCHPPAKPVPRSPSCIMSVTGQGFNLKATLEPLRVLSFPADEEPHTTPFSRRWPIRARCGRPSNIVGSSTCYTLNARAAGSQSWSNLGHGLQVTPHAGHGALRHGVAKAAPSLPPVPSGGGTPRGAKGMTL